MGSWSPLPLWVAAAATACGPVTAGQFPEPVPALVTLNEGRGDPYAGRFPLDEALAGLPEGTPSAVLTTDAGVVHCALAIDTAPLTVANFVGLARGLRPYQEVRGGEWITGPFYDGLPFHRAFPGQFVQTGRRGDQETPGFVLQDERSIGDAFDRPGKLALANAGMEHSGAAQFFITTAELRSFDGKYTIFGRCGDPLVVRALERRALEGDTPILERVEIVVEP